MKATTKLKLKSFFFQPIYRIDVLRAVKEEYKDFRGLCGCISYVMNIYTCLSIPRINEIKRYFPLFGTSLQYFGTTRKENIWDYWWPEYEWSTGRLAYLDWLIEQYKEDKTDIRKL